MTASSALPLAIERPSADPHPSVIRAGDDGAPSAAHPLVPVLMGIGVAVLVVMAVMNTRSSGAVAGLWGANGLAVGVWLRTARGRRQDALYALVLSLSILIAELVVGNKPALSLIFTAASMLEVVTAVVLARRFAPTLDMGTLGGMVRFLICAALVAPIPAAAFSSLALDQMGPHDLVEGFQTWWFGHALGIAVIGVLILSLTPSTVARLGTPRKLLEGVVLLSAVVGVFLVGFSGQPKLGFVMIPVLLAVAVRLGVAATGVSLLVLAVLVVGGAIAGDGPYTAGLTSGEQVLLAQMMVLVGFLPMLPMAAALEERDRLAETTQEGRRRAERASEAKSRLLANVAHEIKSPVAGIIGIGDLWARGGLGPVTPQQEEMADMLVRTARQVEALSHDLLDVARAEAGSVKVELRPTEVCGLLEDVRRASLLRAETTEVEMEVVCEGEGLIALADSQRLAQVLHNLTSNAIKYGAAGGRVVLRATRVHDDIRVEVIDFGPGLTPQKQAQLFEPFNRLGLERSTIEGHGVGLALAKRLIELQGGVIGVQSTPGQGAIFWIQIPAA
ncbi:HAMP domain-containing sensor histidine kinase [Brevundimonas sp. SORGH_AS_0993]|uniref:sensor histidine kinase n=1 Tax=Brevundimonas sp. SORGH_AS_0993 TaxID=3041794 RepID=UPI00278AB20A|nr:HAMP domain-containing sensor histidine kinase [Brevundimonas sp. SORGH_AS_0993]MDQ1152974.1 signal transduction histidine kinase [Brevundimonas sp. SORGH_AS_0993]